MLLANYSFNRQLTLDLLKSLSAKGLQWSPGEGIGPLWKQFRHMGRVQDNYIRAIKTGKTIFDHGIELYPYDGGPSKVQLIKYLQLLDRRLAETIKKAPKSLRIDWFGEKFTLERHIQCLADHEVLHHGQWIAMFTLHRKKMPKSWKVWLGSE